jgi:hypothetical protein
MLVLWCIAIPCAVSAQQHRKPAGSFFDDPQALCKSLAGQGIETGDWRSYSNFLHPDAGPFFCDGRPEFSKQEKDPEEKGIETIFRVSGDLKSRADIISISVTATPGSDIHTAQRDIARYVEAIFQAIDKPQPVALIRSIDTRSYYLARQPYGVVWFNVVKPMRSPATRTLWFRLSKHALESAAAAN